MVAPPRFATLKDYAARRADVGFWRPYVALILERHGLAGSEPAAGIGSTWPTFVCGEVVVKLFGGLHAWRAAHLAERAAHARLATDPQIAAPRLLADGRLYDEPDAWPYLITARMPGVAWRQAQLSGAQRLAIAIELGRQLRRVHALRPAGVASHGSWPAPSVVAAARRSSLPPCLIPQIADFLLRAGPFDAVLVHGDLMFRHVFVEHGRLAGIIDWGDAIATDRHYELAKLHLDLFDGDKALLRAFLEASGWPVSEDFPQKAMALALCRQAQGLAQHPTIDVFYTLPALLPLADIATLDELATALFAV